jgi:sporulation-control protein spo0M
MDIESLLNPAGESQVMTETLDNEIYQAVMDSVETHKDLEINGADDKDDDDPIELELHPTQHDLLKAISTLSKFIEDLDDPAARRLEALLGPFMRKFQFPETTSMKNTVLTDFFQRL